VRYYICRQHPTVEGPFDPTAIASLARSGSIGPETLVCPEGEQAWRPLGSVPELAAFAAGQPAFAAAIPPGHAGGASLQSGVDPEIPPHWARAQRPSRAPLGEMGVGTAMSLGWAAFTANYWNAVAVVGILIGAQFFVNMVQSFGQHLAKSAGAAGLGVALIGTSVLVSTLVFFPLTVGAFLFGVEAVRGRGTLATLGRAFQRVFALVLAYLLWCLGTLLLALPLVVVGLVVGMVVGMSAFTTGFRGSPALVALIIGLVAAILVPMAWLAARLFPTFLLLVDPDRPGLGVLQAFSTSWAITSGHALSIIGLAIVMGLLSIATFLACILPGIFLGYPLLITTYGAAYCLLADRPAVVPVHPGG